MLCSNCGAALKPDARVCDFCGTPVVSAEALASTSSTPEDYIPPAFPYADEPTRQAEPPVIEPEPAPVVAQAVDYTPKPSSPVQDVFPEPSPVAPPPAAAGNGSGYAIASLVIGILGLCLGYIPFCGALFVIIGIILGVVGLKSSQRTLAIVGIVLNVIVLCIGITLTLIGGASLLTSGSGIFPNR